MKWLYPWGLIVYNQEQTKFSINKEMVKPSPEILSEFSHTLSTQNWDSVGTDQNGWSRFSFNYDNIRDRGPLCYDPIYGSTTDILISADQKEMEVIIQGPESKAGNRSDLLKVKYQAHSGLITDLSNRSPIYVEIRNLPGSRYSSDLYDEGIVYVESPLYKCEEVDNSPVATFSVTRVAIDMNALNEQVFGILENQQVPYPLPYAPTWRVPI